MGWAALLATQALAPAEPRMTLGSWLFLGLAWLAVVTLVVWAFRRILRTARRPP